MGNILFCLLDIFCLTLQTNVKSEIVNLISGHVVVLKGAVTLIASPDGRTAFIPIATPALASAGTGDVLSGMITGLIAQGMKAFDAAVAGAWLHARAGVAAAKKQGQTISVIARDVIDQIPFVLKDITSTD